MSERDRKVESAESVECEARAARRAARAEGWGFAITDAAGMVERRGGADLERGLARTPEEGLRNLRELYALMRRFYPELNSPGMDKSVVSIRNLR